MFVDHGHGSQNNTYSMGTTTTKYQDQVTVLVEPPLGSGKYASGSQFGCPVNAFIAKEVLNILSDAIN